MKLAYSRRLLLTAFSTLAHTLHAYNYIWTRYVPLLPLPPPSSRSPPPPPPPPHNPPSPAPFLSFLIVRKYCVWYMTPYSCLPFFSPLLLLLCLWPCVRIHRHVCIVSVLLSLLISQTATRAGHVTCVCFTFQNGFMMMMKWCLMSSHVSWHIRDKLWPMHGSIILYVHGNQKAL